MDLGLEGRVALVTGASRGIGHAIARSLADEGATVAVASRRREAIEAAAQEIGRDRAHPFVYDSDVGDRAGELVEEVAAALGRAPEILVINTGGPPPAPDALAASADDWNAAYRSLVLAPMALIEAAVPAMRERRFGRIVYVSSSAVREVIDPLILSSAHRGGMLAACKTLARQLAPDGITVNTLLPGRIATERIAELHGGSLEEAEAAARRDVPAGRLGRPEEMGAAASFLASEGAAYITGVALLVDGGMTRITA